MDKYCVRVYFEVMVIECLIGVSFGVEFNGFRKNVVRLFGLKNIFCVIIIGICSLMV